MSVPAIDNKTARWVFLQRHALAEPPRGAASGGDLLALIRRLGFVQLDSINTVARAHDMILFSRRPAFRSGNLTKLYSGENTLFEHWTHDAAMIPMAYYPHWHLRFRRDTEMLKKRWKNWRRDGFEDQFETVLRHVRDHGPVCSKDVGKDEKKGSGGWWDWHPSKTALEFLWRSGALTVTGRQGFRKYYDLSERVIEHGLLDSKAHPEEQQSIDWFCGAALDRLGFATPGEIAAFWAAVTPAEAREWCAGQRQKGTVTEVDITSHDGSVRRSFARPDIGEQAALVAPTPDRIRVLSPFDPALRDRARAQRLFGFHYRIEVFVPQAKRQFGYYVFPLMQRDKMIGRIDMKAWRDRDVLNIRAVWPERGVRWSKAKTALLEAEMARVARFSGVGSVEFEQGWVRDPV